MADLLTQINKLRNEKAKKPTFKVGYPSAAEGDNGDIVFRSTEKGLGMYGKINNEWFKFGDGLRIGRFGTGRKYTNSGKWGKDLEGDTITIGSKKTDLTSSSLKTALSLQNVTNESKATMFTAPVLTGQSTIPYIIHSDPQLPILGSGNVDVNVALGAGVDDKAVLSFWSAASLQKWMIAYDNTSTEADKLSFYGPHSAATSPISTIVQPLAMEINAAGTLDTTVTTIHGSEMIIAEVNRTFTGSNGNWAAYDPAGAGGVALAGASGNDLTVDISNTSTAIQGASLSITYFNALRAGRTYVVSADLQAASADGTTGFYFGLGGAVSSSFSIDHSESRNYKKEITVASDAALLIYNTNDDNVDFNIDNVSIKEKGVPTLGNQHGRTIIKADDSLAASLTLIADDGADNGDEWEIQAADGFNTFTIANDKTGSEENLFSILPSASNANLSTTTVAGDLGVNGTSGITAGAPIWKEFVFYIRNSTAARYYMRGGAQNYGDKITVTEYDTVPTTLDADNVGGQFVVPQNCTLLGIQGIVTTVSSTVSPIISVYHGTHTEGTGTSTLASALAVTVTVAADTPKGFSGTCHVNLDAGDIIVPTIHRGGLGYVTYQGSVTLKFITR